MRKIIPTLAILLIAIQAIPGQEKLVQLHPVIGDTISHNEKRLFLLFPEIPDSSFTFGSITPLKNDGYILKSRTTDSNFLKKKLDKKDIEQYRLNIDKILTYYAQLDSCQSKPQNPQLNNYIPSSAHSSINNVLKLTPEQRKSLAREARRYNDLKMEGMNNGLWGQDLDNFIKTSGSWDIPVLGIMLKNAAYNTNPNIDKVVHRKK